MLPNHEEDWNARTGNDKIKKYMKQVSIGDRGLCYQTHDKNQLVAELVVIRGLYTNQNGYDLIRLKLLRFLPVPIPWSIIQNSNIIKQSISRRNTLFKITKSQFDSLLQLFDFTVKEDINSQYKEGGRKIRFTTFYERNPKLRAEVIKIHKTVCTVCKFNFEEHYGSRGALFIEVHHKKPINLLNKRKTIDPKKDMTVVCSNCHRMIHRKKDHILTIEELRRIYYKFSNK